MSLTLDLLTRRRALATPVTRLACALGFLVVSGYAAAADATDAPAGADESSAVGAGAKDGERILREAFRTLRDRLRRRTDTFPGDGAVKATIGGGRLIPLA